MDITRKQGLFTHGAISVFLNIQAISKLSLRGKRPVGSIVSCRHMLYDPPNFETQP